MFHLLIIENAIFGKLLCDEENKNTSKYKDIKKKL